MQAAAAVDFPVAPAWSPVPPEPATPAPPVSLSPTPMPLPSAPKLAPWAAAGPRPASPPGTPRLLITIATYNEAENLAPLIADVHRELPHADVLVIDDNSPDGTGDIADRLRAADPRVSVLHRPGKLGLGTATLAAMTHAAAYGYDLMLNLDADFSHPPRFLKSIIAGMDKHDVMIGSRYARGGGTENWPVTRLVISRTVNSLVRFLFRMPVSDASGAFRCYRVSVLKRARLDLARSRGYSFQQEVLFRCHLAGAKLGETPIIFENRRAGKSKVNHKEAARSIGMILWLGTTHFFGLADYRHG